MRKDVFRLIGVSAMVLLAACESTSRPPLDRGSFSTDGSSVRQDSLSAAGRSETPAAERLSSPRLIDAAKRSADRLMAEGNAAAAADLYKRVYDARPELPTLIQLSRALRQSGNAQQAFLTLRGEERRFSREEGFHVEMARAALDGNFIPEAEAAVAAALATPRAGWASHVINGVLLARKNENAAAREAFNRAQSVARTETERDGAAANLAFLDAVEGRRAEAIAALEPLAAKPDAQRRIIITLAALYGLNGDRERYLATMRRSGLTAVEVEQGSRWLDISLAPPAPTPTGNQRRSANQRP